MGSPSSTSAPVSAIAVTSIRIERARLDAFRKLAESNHRSVSQEMRRLIDEALERKAAA